MGNSVVLFVQSEKSIRWCTLAGPGVTCQRVRSFLGLDDGPLQDLRSAWAKSCTRLAQVAECLPGLCVLQQDLVETIFGFICSQNNNVSRICLLMDRLRATYGELLCSIAPGVDAEGDGDLAVLREFNVQRKLYAFPSVARLAAASEPGTPTISKESSLKALGLGYRAAYVRSAAKMLLQKESCIRVADLTRTSEDDQDGCMLKWLEQSRDSIDLSGIDPLQTEEHLVLSFAVYKMIGLVRKECKAGGDAATAFGSAEGALPLTRSQVFDPSGLRAGGQCLPPPLWRTICWLGTFLALRC
eukprot:g24348.t1